ncbi:MAG: hypothetical protein AB7O49_08560 [Sphingomonadales bacterium]
MKDTEALMKVIDAILLEMAVPHPYLTEAEEAAMKTRLFAIMEAEHDHETDPREMVRLFREAVKAS